MYKKIGVKILKQLGMKKNQENKFPYLEVYNELFSADSIRNKKFYNIGAGTFRHPNWTNVDYSTDWYSKSQERSIFINFDLQSLEKLPIDDNTAEIVYSSHTIEHITDKAAQNLFNEVYRILKKEGILRITAPNIDLDYRAFINRDTSYYYWIDTYSSPRNYNRIKIRKPMNQASLHQIFLYHFAAQVSELHMDETIPKISDKELEGLFATLEYEEALTHCTSRCSLDIQNKNPGNHINWWNEKKTTQMLKKTGFEDIYSSRFGQSVSPVLRNTNIFDCTQPKISFYIEARK